MAASDSDDLDDLTFLLSDDEDNEGNGKGKQEDIVILYVSP